MPDVSWNQRSWDGDYDWNEKGEEWSEPWGGSEAQWFGSLYPRLHRFFPVGNLLEIAPGYGRWTSYLLDYVKGNYVGIDLAEKCISYCEERFSGQSNASFYCNDGLSLDRAEDGQFDMVFSFDSLVHADLDVHQRYVPQIIRKLTPNGVAFVHHSNWAGSGSSKTNIHYRAEDVSAAAYASIVCEGGGHVLIQECINWRTDEKIDAFTLFCRANRESLPGLQIENPGFMHEASLIQDVQSHYARIGRSYQSGR
jgi:SAM-dependent methyltransferase